LNWQTRVTEILNIRYPIIQGGLAHLAYSELAAAVSNAGGLGQITAMSLDNPAQLREEIRKVKGLTNKPSLYNGKSDIKYFSNSRLPIQ
jgi:NADH:quinone reductase (non-electrogenic)